MTGMVAIDRDQFRRALSHLPTGVTVITAHGSAGPVGMSANSFTSVSLDPPLVLFCPARSSTTWPEIRATGAFCVNIMASHHEDLTRRFSAKGLERFADVEWTRLDTGPALEGAVGTIECVIEREVDAGDHTVVIGAVVAIEARPDIDPLVFFRGSYGSFRSEPDAASNRD